MARSAPVCPREIAFTRAVTTLDYISLAGLPGQYCNGRLP